MPSLGFRLPRRECPNWQHAHNRKRISERNSYASPCAGGEAAIVVLNDISRETGLQDHRTEVVADEAAQRERALPLVGWNQRTQVGRTKASCT